MDLSRNVIKRYVAVTSQEKVTSNSDTRYGTVVSEGDELFVMIDGSNILTPVSSTIDLREGDRVLVLVKNHEATVLGSPTSPTARLEELRALEKGVSEFEVILADKVGTGELVAMQALIEDLEAKDVEITGKLTANDAKIESLEAENVTINGKLEAYQADIEELDAKIIDSDEIAAKYATIESLKAVDADIDTLNADYGTFKQATVSKLDAYDATIEGLDATYATIDQLDAEKGRITDLEATRLKADDAVIKNLQADIADIDTLIFGSASGTTIQTSFANAVIAQLGNAQIKSAMIDSLSADKITAGDILTNNVRVLSEDGKLLISDETIQISDDTRVRVQIGKDASNDYSVNVWDAAGKLMFSAGGITDAAIKSAIIRDDMVSETANIKASKLDISSLFSEINNSTETINSNKVLIDTDAGTLDVAFVKMESDINDISEEVSTQGTALSVVQGQISSKIWMEDIKETDLSEVEGAISTLETQYSELNQTVDGISATVGQHTTQIANKADSSTVTAVSDRVTEAEADLEGFRTSVSETYATKTEMNKKADDYTILLYNGTRGNPKPVKFATVNYSTCNSENGVCVKISMVSGHGNGTSYAFLQDATIRVNYNGGVEVDNVKQYGAESPTYDDAVRQYGDIFWVVDTTNKIVDFYCLMGQYSRVYQTPWRRMTYSTGGTVTQYTSATVYSSGTKVWANNSDIALMTDVTELSERVTTAETNINQNAEAIALRATKSELTTVSTAASDAQSAAEAAQSTANTAKTNAATAQTTANNAAAAASNAQKSADDAQDTADGAVTAASNAQSTADTAKANAATAQSTADTAKANAATAQTTASNAATAASNAQKAADDAQDTADGAATAASNAQSTANTAKTNAATAQSTADTAKANAATAQSTADTAKANAKTAQDTADGVKTDLANNYYTKTQTDAQIKVSADAITSTVASLEETLAEDYSTTTQMNSAIEQKANSITQTVSSTYATKTALSTTDTKAANAATAASNAQKAADNAQSTADTAKTNAATAQSTANTAKTNAATAQSTADTAKTNAATAQTTADNAQDAADAAQDTADNAANIASTAQSGVESLEPRVETTESAIIQLSDSITQFVRGADGASLLQQDQNGLTYFDFSSFQAALDANTAGLSDATNIIGAWQDYKENTTLTEFLKTVQGTLDDYGVTLEYVHTGTYDDPDTGNTEPCIELGESDSHFKLLITNTRIVFMEGNNPTTYIKNDTLVTNNVEIKGDFRHGGYVWSVRQNGNYGLTWRG